MKKLTALLLGMMIVATLIPAESHATMVDIINNDNALNKAEMISYDTWIDKPGYTHAYSEALRFQTSNESGVQYKVSIVNDTSGNISAFLKHKNTVKGEWTFEGDSVQVDSGFSRSMTCNLEKSSVYCLIISAYGEDYESYSVRVEKQPILPSKGRLAKVAAGKKRLTVKYGKTSWTNHYQIAIKKKGGKWKYYKTTKLSKVFKKLSKKKKYSVKVRGIRIYNNKAYYGAWSAVKTVRVK